MPGVLARVHVQLQPDGGLVQLARLVATGVATSVGMGIDETEDCRAAVDELCSTLVECAGANALLELDLVAEESTDGVVTLEVRGQVSIDQPVTIDEVRREISEMILDAVTDSHDEQVDAAHGEASFRFVRTAGRRGARPAEGGAA